MYPNHPYTDTITCMYFAKSPKPMLESKLYHEFGQWVCGSAYILFVYIFTLRKMQNLNIILVSLTLVTY